MRRLYLTASVAAAAFVSGAGWAQECCESEPEDTEIINQQIQLGDVFSDMNVVVPGSTDGDATSISMAYGNTVSGYNGNGGANVQSDQTFDANAEANAALSGGDIGGTAAANAIAYGNSAVWETHNGSLTGDQLNQVTADGSNITARTSIDVGTTNAISSAATATANTTAVYVYDGDNTVTSRQFSGANVLAENSTDACCDNESSTTTATAVSNSYHSWSTTSTVNADVEQSATGTAVTARVSVNQTDGNDVVGAANASANSITVDNEWGYARLEGSQDNQSDVAAESTVTLTDWSGMAASSANGVGNSALLTNIGSDAALDFSQTNSGDVYTTAEFDGDTTYNGTVTTNSTSIGNAFTGFVCTTCGDGVMGGTIYQSNSGDVRSVGQGYAGASGGYAGAASAIGNSATFMTSQAQNSGGGG